MLSTLGRGAAHGALAATGFWVGFVLTANIIDYRKGIRLWR